MFLCVCQHPGNKVYIAYIFWQNSLTSHSFPLQSGALWHQSRLMNFPGCSRFKKGLSGGGGEPSVVIATVNFFYFASRRVILGVFRFFLLNSEFSLLNAGFDYLDPGLHICSRFQSDQGVGILNSAGI